MESHKTPYVLLMDKNVRFQTVFPCDDSLSHRILPQATGLSERHSAHLGSNIFNKSQWRTHFYRFQVRNVETSLLHFLKNKLFVVSIHFVNPRNHILRRQKLASRKSSERVYIVHYWSSL